MWDWNINAQSKRKEKYINKKSITDSREDLKRGQKKSKVSKQPAPIHGRTSEEMSVLCQVHYCPRKLKKHRGRGESRASYHRSAANQIAAMTDTIIEEPITKHEHHKPRPAFLKLPGSIRYLLPGPEWCTLHRNARGTPPIHLHFDLLNLLRVSSLYCFKWREVPLAAEWPAGLRRPLSGGLRFFNILPQTRYTP